MSIVDTSADVTYESPWADFAGHEQVVIAQDEPSGLLVVIAIHSTVLGPALGGTRMSLYAASPNPGWAARQDALRLSRAMTYKNALAGLDHGGGKGVILADPAMKSVALLHAYGRVVESLGGRYVTAGDLDMTVHDMDVIGEACPWTTGRSPERGGVGDSGILTAVGVWQGYVSAGMAGPPVNDYLYGVTSTTPTPGTPPYTALSSSSVTAPKIDTLSSLSDGRGRINSTETFATSGDQTTTDGVWKSTGGSFHLRASKFGTNREIIFSVKHTNANAVNSDGALLGYSGYASPYASFVGYI